MNERPIISWVKQVAGRVGLREAGVLIVLLLITFSTWMFIEIADEVREGASHDFDAWILRALRDADDQSRQIGPRWLPNAARDITALGGSAVILLVIGASAGYLILARKPHAMWLVLGATISGQLLSWGLKEIFRRDRPDIVPHAVEVTSASFPSGHAMNSAVVYLTLAALLMRLAHTWRAKAYIIAVALMLTSLIGFSRVYLGVHFPTDVLAGWTAGLTWALLWWLIARMLQRRGAIEQSNA